MLFIYWGETKITQSNAILRYIGRQHNLLGGTEAEKVRVDMMLEQSMDFRNGTVRLAYNPKFVSGWKREFSLNVVILITVFILGRGIAWLS